ncbi:ATP-binding cassette domain-containing protein, partial [Candidatus Aerophobetes bacterium]|nr:ATP-binding cassette domain-containing protein [Candidatus Aerophobetes bacterium]
MAEVILKGVYKRYGRVEAVKNLNLHIKDKEFFCLLGPSGCGKSSTLRMIAGLEEISEGIIKIGNRIINNLEPKDRDVAMVFENYALYPHMTVYENLSYPLKGRGMTSSEIDKRVRYIAGLLQIAELLDRKPRQLSGGQKQRVALGRAIVRNPQVFLMDEPISHLDAKLRTLMRAELKRLQRELNTTTIYATPDQREAIAMADTIAIINKGEIQQIGTPLEIFNFPANEFVAGFTGEPPMNLFDCSVESKK